MFSHVLGILLRTLTLSLTLSACNGGGSDPVPGGGGTTPPPATPDLQTTVPPPTYAANSAELKYFNGINAMRQQLGLGLLAQNPLLDTATSNHVEYLRHIHSEDPDWILGTESPQKSGFTGATPQARCDHVAYLGQCQTNHRWSEFMIQSLPSHYMGLVLLTQGARDIGIKMLYGGGGFTGSFDGPEIQLGIQTGKVPQKQGGAFLLTAELWRVFHVQINEGETLTVDSFQVWNASNQPVAGQVLTQANDPLGRVPAHAAMLVPDNWSGGQSCDGGIHTLYFAGKRNGIPFTVNRPLDRVYCPFQVPSKSAN